MKRTTTLFGAILTAGILAASGTGMTTAYFSDSNTEGTITFEYAGEPAPAAPQAPTAPQVPVAPAPQAPEAPAAEPEAPAPDDAQDDGAPIG